MSAAKQELSSSLKAGLEAFEAAGGNLPGAASADARAVLIQQLIDSVRRVDFVDVVAGRSIDGRRGDPTSPLFDPLRASLLQKAAGDADESAWMVFFFVHFGKSRRGGWRYAADVYRGLGTAAFWTWERTSKDPAAFRRWLAANEEAIRGAGAGGFGNHRKYQSLSASSPAGTGAAFESYVKWVGPGGHLARFESALAKVDADPGKAFDELYQSMQMVASFGRMARFDYLTMIGKVKLAKIKPASAYLSGATGPVEGARLLFGATSASAKVLQERFDALDVYLRVGMQVLEDALCNWQKSPTKYVYFGG